MPRLLWVVHAIAQFNPTQAKKIALYALFSLSALVTGCGTNFTASGVGSGGTGLADGTISGFGSIIVDGVSFDDRTASTTKEDATTSNTLAEAKLGQRIRVRYNNTNAAVSAEIMPSLIASVTAAADTTGLIHTSGGWVKVIQVTDSVTKSTPTLLANYASAAAIAVGDRVEVHGDWQLDSTLNQYVLIATRIETVANDGYSLFSGVTTAKNASSITLNNNLTLNNASGTLITAVNTGDWLRAWVKLDSANAWQIVKIHKLALSAAELVGISNVQVSGLPQSYDATSNTAVIKGVPIKLTSATAVDSTALKNGQYMRMTGRHNDGNIDIDNSTLRDDSANTNSSSDQVGSQINIVAIKSNIDWTQAVVNFSLRTQQITADQSVISSNCKLPAISVAQEVRVHAHQLNAQGVIVADGVECKIPDSTSMLETIEYKGTLSSVDSVNGQLVVTTHSGSTVTAVWDATTLFKTAAASMIGQQVEIEGAMVNGVYHLKKFSTPDHMLP